MSPHYLVKCRTSILFPSKRWWLRKQPDALCGNLNVRQETSQQVFKVITFCMDTCFQYFSPLINRIVHHSLVKISPCLNKPLPQLMRIVRIGTWDTRFCIMPRCSNQPCLRHDCWLATCQDWWTAVSHGAEARLCQSAMCWCIVLVKDKHVQAMLRIAGSSSGVSNTCVQVVVSKQLWLSCTATVAVHFILIWHK